jgi:membrane-associated protease RseP (regulator of RpoE activity)
VNTKLTRLTVAIVVGGILAPMSVLAAPDAAEYAAAAAEMDAQQKAMEAQQKDLDAQLADARARLEEAAHEVAELSSEMSGPVMDHMMSIYEDGPPRAVLGVQLDERSGKDGARIQEVSPGGPAAEAGLRVGDVITSINGVDVKGDRAARQVMRAMRKVAPESKVKVRVLREGKSQEFELTPRPGMAHYNVHMPPIPPIPPIPPMAPMPPNEVYGPVFIRGPLGEMELVSLTPQLGRYFGTDKGVLVVRAPKDFKLEDGDVILAIDGRAPTSGSHATRILGSYQPGEKIAIKVMRQQKTVNVDTTLPERGSLGRPGREDREGPGGKVRLEHRVAGTDSAT